MQVRTDMGGADARRSVVEGADTAVWLAAAATPLKPGLFYADRAVVDKYCLAFLLP